mmetsp:Transcript_23102/g.91636  ORF Transcript_23102/g.91636 Transcript_23102/m.91636 type:complete len:202 (-) Transcript_23102:1149-1754(-)
MRRVGGPHRAEARRVVVVGTESGAPRQGPRRAQNGGRGPRCAARRARSSRFQQRAAAAAARRRRRCPPTRGRLRTPLPRRRGRRQAEPPRRRSVRRVPDGSRRATRTGHPQDNEPCDHGVRDDAGRVLERRALRVVAPRRGGPGRRARQGFAVRGDASADRAILQALRGRRRRRVLPVGARPRRPAARRVLRDVRRWCGPS